MYRICHKLYNDITQELNNVVEINNKTQLDIFMSTQDEKLLIYCFSEAISRT